jgi:hypothetical protein
LLTVVNQSRMAATGRNQPDTRCPAISNSHALLTRNVTQQLDEIAKSK